jgi:hypothetical protein
MSRLALRESTGKASGIRNLVASHGEKAEMRLRRSRRSRKKPDLQIKANLSR